MMVIPFRCSATQLGPFFGYFPNLFGDEVAARSAYPLYRDAPVAQVPISPYYASPYAYASPYPYAVPLVAGRTAATNGTCELIFNSIKNI